METSSVVETHSTQFSIKLHHGGAFTKSPNRKYNNGNITCVDTIDSDKFYVNEIDSMLEDLGYDGHREMFYHFLKSCCDLDDELEPIVSDKDVLLLAKLRKRKIKQLRKQAHANEQIYNTYLYVGKEFPNKDEVKAYIKEHSTETRMEIRMEKNDNKRVRVACRGVITSLPALEDLGRYNLEESP
nr:transposase, mutator type [Tanacetum cinerariifolium]